MATPHDQSVPTRDQYAPYGRRDHTHDHTYDHDAHAHDHDLHDHVLRDHDIHDHDGHDHDAHPYGRNAYVAHAGSDVTDVYGPGKVLAVDGDYRRVRFIHFVATVRAADLRPANEQERAELTAWLRAKAERYGSQWWGPREREGDPARSAR
ncbi:hypothetical protein [Streptomyces sp. G45]|uniref:hypothetical protein n=1 Tax=Streptomyces sp. G45 TaxID=3406627 RepID=UPI003C27664A